MKGKSLISINDLTKEDFLRIIDLAEKYQNNSKEYENKLIGKIVALLFFEPSTRTRLSFETAVLKMGGKVIGFDDPSSSSVQKGESLKDTILTISQYCDLIIIRHPLEGSARWASEVTTIPVINAGDGSNQHPTQCLLDLYSIKKTQNTLENLSIMLVGDLKYSRTVHSLIMALAHFNPTFYLISPNELKLPFEYKMFLKERSIRYYESSNVNDFIDLVDIMYVTRVQRERFSDPVEYEKVKNSYVIKSDLLVNTKNNLRILHPLPRVNEISEDVDFTDKAYYFQQALNGVYVRMALISLIFDLV